MNKSAIQKFAIQNPLIIINLRNITKQLLKKNDAGRDKTRNYEEGEREKRKQNEGGKRKRRRMKINIIEEEEN